MNQYQKDVARLVLDLPQAHPYRPAFLDKPPRLVFQVAREAETLKEPPPEAAPEPPPPPPSRPSGSARAGAAKGPADSLARQLGLKVKTVVIDPGHGGKDNGAAAFGLREKDIVLKLSQKLADRLTKRLGLTVFLTRNDDRFLTLSRRSKIALDKKADLFISIHVNANDLGKVEGLETYILNFATDRSAMAVAARENAAADKTISELQDILQTLAQNTKIAESGALAQAMHKAAVTALAKNYSVRDLGVKEAPFLVLVGTESPALLIETGFITNEKEAGRLNTGAYLDRLADGLADGLASYLKGFSAK
jgi:N-acetylmuramoyl-L-alanine amidase